MHKTKIEKRVALYILYVLLEKAQRDTNSDKFTVKR